MVGVVTLEALLLGGAGVGHLLEVFLLKGPLNVSEEEGVSVIDILMHVDTILQIVHQSDLIAMAGATVTGNNKQCIFVEVSFIIFI